VGMRDVGEGLGGEGGMGREVRGGRKGGEWEAKECEGARSGVNRREGKGEWGERREGGEKGEERELEWGEREEKEEKGVNGARKVIRGDRLKKTNLAR